MSLARGLLIAVLIAAVSIATIGVRQNMASCSYRIQQLHQQQVRLEQELWSRQMELARLRLPENLRQRLDQLGVDLRMPRIVRRATTQKSTVSTHD